MNIIQKTKILFTLLFISLFAELNATENGRTLYDSTFALSVELGSGITGNYDHFQTKFSPSAGIYWEPNHLLYIGIETSYISIKNKTRHNIETEFGRTSFRASLTAIPVVFTYRMLISEFTFTGGIGTAFVSSNVSAFDTHVSAGFWYYCYYFSLAYTCKISEKTDLAIAAITYSLPRIEQNLAGMNFKISYDIYRW